MAFFVCERVHKSERSARKREEGGDEIFFTVQGADRYLDPISRVSNHTVRQKRVYSAERTGNGHQLPAKGNTTTGYPFSDPTSSFGYRSWHTVGPQHMLYRCDR